VDRATVYRWASAGHLPAIRLGPGAVRFDPEALEAWVSGQTVGKRSREVPKVQTSSTRVQALRAGVLRKAQAAGAAVA
jgi:excisionase family DNA binding protein